MPTAHAYLGTCRRPTKVDDIGESDFPASWKQQDVRLVFKVSLDTKQTKESAEDRNKEHQDNATGEEMRKWAMERLAKTKKRNGKDEPR